MIIELENGERFEILDTWNFGIWQGDMRAWIPTTGQPYKSVELKPVNDKARELHKKYYDAILKGGK